MKIRTKLLLALGAISLFPPAAAFVAALVSDSRISFALKMNEFEAQQGLNSQRLQSDLNVIGSALEESLSETYRIHSESREREDAEQKRRLANAAFRSGIAAYEAHLNAASQSEAQQVLHAGIAGPATVLDAAEQRETQLLQELNGSLSSVKSKAEEFIRLSNSSSRREEELVQKSLDSEVRGELAKTVQELMDETEHAAERYRRSIERAQKQSYKQTILIALIALAVSIALAVVVARAIIRPIQRLRDAVAQLGLGHMDTRVGIHSKDELGELAVGFDTMAENLAKAHEKLKNSMGELGSRNREAAALSEMADLLQSCFTLEEASGVIASSAQKLFPRFSGAVLVFSASRNVLEAVTTWGPSSPAERVFSPNDCWALRRGRLHHSSSEDGAIRCSHFGAESRLPSICTPLMAHGETLGILCLVTEPDGAVGTSHAISEFNVHLAVSVAEQAALSFANLKLREKLRYQSIRDPLTGLFNRRYLDESLERELPNAIRKNRNVGVIMLDVDRFKKFNDMFGHDAGDTVLRELGDYLAKFVRRGDLACRYGGEEFTLILPESALEDTRRRAEELRIAFQQLSIKHRDIVLGKVTLSLGVATLPDHGTTALELLAAADGALLKAKEQGRDRVLVAEAPTNRSEVLP
jgi:diguanylate cyclase (GGDEF)-like protein